MSTEAAKQVKETKAQKVERLKAAEEPSGSALRKSASLRARDTQPIPDEWIKTYFRWWGVYTQGDGAGAVGGIGGEGRATPYFMLRIRLSNGFVTAPPAARDCRTGAKRMPAAWQTLPCARISSCTGSRSKIFQKFWKLFLKTGLTSMATCGDVTRNVTGCPLAGLDAHELCDASPLVDEVTRAARRQS